MRKSLFVFAAIAAICAIQPVSAHLSYSGRNFGTLVIDGPEVSNVSQTVSSAFGWADGTDANWGDSHRGRFFRFTLTNAASVTISAQRNASGSGATNTFLPGISLFEGLGQSANGEGVMQGEVFRAEQAGHDGAALSEISRPGGTEGSFRSMTSWSLGNEDTYVTNGNPTSGILIPARLASFTYIGHAADGVATNYGPEIGILGDGNADGFVTASIDNLPAGTYTIYIGGAHYNKQIDEPGPTFPTYGVNVSVKASSLTAYDSGVAAVTSNPGAFNLYTASEMLDMNLGGLVIQEEEGNVTVRIQLQSTEDLEQPFQDVGAPIDVPVPMENSNSFLRINASPLP